jgi:hypothetical protein
MMVELVDIIFKFFAIVDFIDDVLVDMREKIDRNDADFKSEFESF